MCVLLCASIGMETAIQDILVEVIVIAIALFLLDFIFI